MKIPLTGDYGHGYCWDESPAGAPGALSGQGMPATAEHSLPVPEVGGGRGAGRATHGIHPSNE